MSTTTSTYKTVPAALINGNSRLPLRRTNSKPNGIATPLSPPPNQNYNRTLSYDETARWKQKYEEAEDKRKNLLTQNERARRSIYDLERKCLTLQNKNEEMETELFEKNESLAKLTTVSKSLFKEYDALKNQYDVETEAMNKVLVDASTWYRENKALRRRTLLLDSDSVDEGVDACESSDSDLDNLKESVKSLSAEVAHLQAELNAAKLAEFETTEINVQISQELEDEKRRNTRLEQQLRELNSSHEQMIRVSNMMKRELEDLKELVKNQKSTAETLRKEADDYKKERNVLAHRSTILLQGLNNDDGLDSLLLMQEIEELKCTLEDERNKHLIELQSLQEKIEEYEKNSEIEILEERIKLLESELQHASEKIERAEQKIEELKMPPPPPPPPAPPMMPPPPPVVPLRIKKMNRNQTNATEPDETCVDKKPNAVGGVNDDIINQIKGGQFTLRKAEKASSKKDRETPKAVSEMLNILGSLRRTSKSKSSTLKPANNLVDIIV